MKCKFLYSILVMLYITGCQAKHLDDGVNIEKEAALPLGYYLGMTHEQFYNHSNELKIDTAMLVSFRSTNSFALSSKKYPNYEQGHSGEIDYPLPKAYVFCNSDKDSLITIAPDIAGIHYYFDSSDNKKIPIAIYPKFTNEHLTECLFQIHGCKKEFFTKYLLSDFPANNWRLPANTGNRPSLHGIEGIKFYATDTLKQIVFNEWKSKNKRDRN